jgi:hypothetical protein
MAARKEVRNDLEVREKLSTIMFKYQIVMDDFETRLHEVSGFEQFETIGGDGHDLSIEFYGVEDEVRLDEATQRFIFDEGFDRCWLNHKNGMETYYYWCSVPSREIEGFMPSEGHRKESVRHRPK